MSPPPDGIPSICPKCGHSVKFWRDDKGHMVTVACDELDKHGLQYTPRPARGAAAEEGR